MFHPTPFKAPARVRWGKHLSCSLFAMTFSAPAFAATLYVDPVVGCALRQFGGVAPAVGLGQRDVVIG